MSADDEGGGGGKKRTSVVPRTRAKTSAIGVPLPINGEGSGIIKLRDLTKRSEEHGVQLDTFGTTLDKIAHRTHYLIAGVLGIVAITLAVLGYFAKGSDVAKMDAMIQSTKSAQDVTSKQVEILQLQQKTLSDSQAKTDQKIDRLDEKVNEKLDRLADKISNVAESIRSHR